MHSSSYIRQACRRRLWQERLPQGQWNPRATFISLSGIPRTTTDESQKGHPPGRARHDEQDEIVSKRRPRSALLPRRATASKQATVDLESLFVQAADRRPRSGDKIGHGTVSSSGKLSKQVENAKTRGETRLHGASKQDVHVDAARTHRPPNLEYNDVTPSSFKSTHPKIRGVNSGSFVTRQLQRAATQRNLFEVEALWSDVAMWPLHEETHQSQKGTLSLELGNHFMSVFMGLGQPNRAIEVWNHIVKVGLQPAVTSWEAMLSGCKTGKDWHSMEEVWEKMLASGMQPNVHCWTTRVSGLMSCKQHEMGLRALDEMGRLWLEAAKLKHPRMELPELQLVNDVEDAVKPSINPVNAALSVLVKTRRQQLAQQILDWAATFGIRPDVVTYNIYLRPLIRYRDIGEASKLLKQMSVDGVKPDVATFTTILDEAFPSNDSRTADEQRAIIDTLFSEMEVTSVSANLQMYGKIIYRLLSNRNADMSTVNAVLVHMSRRGVQPSTHIYAALMDYHFNQQPPNVDAVKNIIQRASSAGAVDRVFWDKAVGGYARMGETGPALKILGQLNGENTRIGWSALRTLLLALAENQEWETARSVVRDAVNDADGRLPDYKSLTIAQNTFWHLAGELKLLDEYKKA